MNKLDKTYKKAVDLTEKIKILLQRKIDDCESRLYEYRKELEDIVNKNIDLEEENKKLKERIEELETTNKKRTADNWTTFK